MRESADERKHALGACGPGADIGSALGNGRTVPWWWGNVYALASTVTVPVPSLLANVRVRVFLCYVYIVVL